MIKTKLPNGMRLHLDPVGGIHSAALGFLIRTGSRHEQGSLNGVSHFLEHMCFKSTRHRSTEALSKDVDDMGAQWNGFTWWEGTAYYMWVTQDQVSNALEILCDMMRPRLRADELEVERNVILEEISLYEDCPDDLIVDQVFSTVFGGHPLGLPIQGTEESVRGMTRTEIAAYHRRRYQPDRMELVAIGNFDPDELTKMVRKRCGRWKSGRTRRRWSPPKFRTVERHTTRPGVTRTYIGLALPAPPRSDSLAPSAEVISNYLGDEQNSRLFWAIKQKGLAEEISVDYEGFTDTGVLAVYATVHPDNARKVLRLIRKELDGIHRRLDVTQVVRARNKLMTDLVCESENCYDRFDFMVSQLAAGSPIITLHDELHAVEKVDPKTIAKYLRRFPLNRGHALVTLGPNGADLRKI